VANVNSAERASVLDEAVRLFRISGPEWELETALNNRALTAWHQGEDELATDLREEQLERARRRGDDLAIAYAAGGLAPLKAVVEGDLEAATRLAEEALTSARRSGSGNAIYASLIGLANLLVHWEAFPAAIAALEEALEIENRPGSRIGDIGDALQGLAQVAYQAGNFDQALEYLSQHQGQIEGVGYGDPEERLQWGTSTIWLRGEIEVARGNHQRGVVILAAVHTAGQNQVLSAYYYKRFDDVLAEARKGLSEQAFTSAWNEGAAMTPNQALDYALHDQP
jgi:tetratricopeptide (TPR) repeat protein